MIFRQLFDPTSCTYTYIIASECGGEGLIIDPVFEHTEQYLKIIGELGLKLVITLETHTHADHVTASGSLRESTQCCIAMAEESRAEYIGLRIHDDENIEIDGTTLHALHTPGHTDDSYCFLMEDRVFTGDT